MFLKKYGLYILLLIFINPPSSHASSDVVEEYQIKAVYLFNFALFFTWPNYVFKSPKQPFRICVLGDAPFGIDLNLVVENEKIEGRRVLAQRIRSIRKSKYCQILFVSHSEQYRLSNILAYLKYHPILTVSDFQGFAMQGGMIQFFNTVDNQVRFLIAPEAVDDANLIASANLLEIARIVHRRR